MIKLVEFYRENGYPINGAAYQRITNRIKYGEYPVYSPSPKVRYITEEVAQQILAEVPPPEGEEAVEEDMEVEDARVLDASEEPKPVASDEVTSLRHEIVALRKAIEELTSAMRNR